MKSIRIVPVSVLTLFLSLSLSLSLLSSCSSNETLYIVTTGDVHGAWFDKPYVGDNGPQSSLMSVSRYVDSLRRAVGKRNVLLLDAGDNIQGDNASYYFNYVDTVGEHLHPRLLSYMGYDAVVVGNHEMETGHPVYDKVASQLEARGIPMLAGNYLKTDGSCYFREYATFRRAGRKILVLGYGNANIKAWLNESLWYGIGFESLLPFVQQGVDRAVAAEKPDLVVVVVHSGTGEGTGEVLESQGRDLFNSLKGVDVLVTAHDHQPYSEQKDGIVMVNAGTKAANVGLVTVSNQDGHTLATACTVPMDRSKVDEKMEKAFEADFEAVREFTVKPVGELSMTMNIPDAFAGMCNYINFLHTVQLSVPEAQISFAAPLSSRGSIEEGTVVFNDMFKIYPYENELFVVKMTGKEIKDYLEFSYDGWIQTPGKHILRIQNRPDPRSGSTRWSFIGRSYNFDSAAGIVYTVDVTAPYGNRVKIESLASGDAFSEDLFYNVAMTSYRSSGGGNLVPLGAGIKDMEGEGRVLARYPAIRTMVCDYFTGNGTVTPELVSDPSVIGSWKFVPESVVHPLLEEDMERLFKQE